MCERMRPFEPYRFSEEVLKANGITSSFGVPDSSLSGLLSYFSATKAPPEHIVTANEGAAVALAAGYYLSTQRIALVFMQNSGLANALNPLQSLAAKEVYGFPMLLMIGWRGKPGEKDEPQHALIGPRLLDNLKANDLPYEVMPDSISGAKEAVIRLTIASQHYHTPVALIVPTRTFSEYDEMPLTASPTDAPDVTKLKWLIPSVPDKSLSRELAIRCLIENVGDADVVVSSLGGNTRELYMIRKESGENIARNFFCIGAMGHTFALAYGISSSLSCSIGRVFCIDGDGSFLMHVGNNAVLAGISYPNLVHVVIYNGVHSSTGDQPLMISRANFLSMAEALPYGQKFLVNNSAGLRDACKSIKTSGSTGRSTLIIVVVNNSVRGNLPRPKESLRELKVGFIETLHSKL